MFDRLNGLQEGAQVRVSGMAAGELLKTQVPNTPDGQFRVRLRIQQNPHALVRADSVAAIKTNGVAGSAFVDIQKGTRRTPELPSGGTIPSMEPLDIADLVQQGRDLLKITQNSVDDLGASADRSLRSINSVATHADETVTALRPDLEAIAASARRTSAAASEIVAQVAHGQGTIGKLLIDRKVAGSVDQMVEDARRSALNLSNASARLNATMIALNQAVATFMRSPPGGENAAENLRDTVASARIAMTNLAADTEALKHNFFLRGFFNKRGYFNVDQMTPAQYRSSKFLQRHSYERVWLSKMELFSSAPGDKEELTKAGQQQIDDGMSALVPYLPNSPIVVEGYATQGAPSERFIREQERADAVRMYISKRFGLQPGMVNLMPMSDTPRSGVGKSVWDGVSLVLIH